MLIAHIVIALLSVGFATFLYLFPSRKKMNISTVLLASTLITGTILVVSHPAHIVSACVSGLVYLAFVSSLMYFSSRKIAAVTAKIND